MGSYRNNYARKVADTARFNTREAFAAACAAQRVNGDYLKLSETDHQGDRVRIANKHLTRDFIDSKFDIREEDRAQAENVILHFQGLTFKILQGKVLSDFETKAMECATCEEVGVFELAVISSLPSCYIRAKARQDTDSRLRDTDGYIGNVGDKVDIYDFEIVRCRYSENWNTYFVTGITPDNKAVFFSYRNNIDVGAIVNLSGKVKAHKENQTQLNYVKGI